MARAKPDRRVPVRPYEKHKRREKTKTQASRRIPGAPAAKVIPVRPFDPSKLRRRPRRPLEPDLVCKWPWYWPVGWQRRQVWFVPALKAERGSCRDITRQIVLAPLATHEVNMFPERYEPGMPEVPVYDGIIRVPFPWDLDIPQRRLPAVSAWQWQHRRVMFENLWLDALDWAKKNGRPLRDARDEWCAFLDRHPEYRGEEARAWALRQRRRFCGRTPLGRGRRPSRREASSTSGSGKGTPQGTPG